MRTHTSALRSSPLRRSAATLVLALAAAHGAWAQGTATGTPPPAAAAPEPAASEPADLPPAAEPAPTPRPANEQVIDPRVQRRNVHVPKIPSNDFEFGVFGGVYSVENFGSSVSSGIRLGYHITEDFFSEITIGTAKVSDEDFDRLLVGNLIQEDRLVYFNLLAGLNVMPGEVFFGRNYAFTSAGYIVAGIGATRFNGRRQQTVTFGAGMRLFVADWVSAQVDVRDHMFSSDVLGELQSTHNPELTIGVTFFF